MRAPPLATGLSLMLIAVMGLAPGVSARPVLATTPGDVAAAETAGTTADGSPVLSLRLDQATQSGDQCQLMFVLENRMGAGIDALQAETVLLTGENRVLRLTMLDFQSLPESALRVRSFNLPGVQCDQIGRVLINAVAVCTPLDAGACSAALEVGSDSGIEVLQ